MTVSPPVVCWTMISMPRIALFTLGSTTVPLSKEKPAWPNGYGVPLVILRIMGRFPVQFRVWASALTFSRSCLDSKEFSLLTLLPSPSLPKYKFCPRNIVSPRGKHRSTTTYLIWPRRGRRRRMCFATRAMNRSGMGVRAHGSYWRAGLFPPSLSPRCPCFHSSPCCSGCNSAALCFTAQKTH